MHGGNYVIVQTDSNACVSNLQLLLPCFTLDGRDLGSIPSTELAIVPGSQVVRGQIEIQDMCDKSAAQELADLRTIDLRAKAGAYYSKCTTRDSPIDNPVSSLPRSKQIFDHQGQRRRGRRFRQGQRAEQAP